MIPVLCSCVGDSSWLHIIYFCILVFVMSALLCGAQLVYQTGKTVVSSALSQDSVAMLSWNFILPLASCCKNSISLVSSWTSHAKNGLHGNRFWNLTVLSDFGNKKSIRRQGRVNERLLEAIELAIVGFGGGLCLII